MEIRGDERQKKQETGNHKLHLCKEEIFTYLYISIHMYAHHRGFVFPLSVLLTNVDRLEVEFKCSQLCTIHMGVRLGGGT